MVNPLTTVYSRLETRPNAIEPLRLDRTEERRQLDKKLAIAQLLHRRMTPNTSLNTDDVTAAENEYRAAFDHPDIVLKEPIELSCMVATKYYRCGEYVFENEDWCRPRNGYEPGSNPYVFTSKRLQKNNYTPVPPERIQPGDILAYQPIARVLFEMTNHFGRVVEAPCGNPDGIRVESRMYAGPVIEHGVGHVPIACGSLVFAFRPPESLQQADHAAQVN